MAEEEARLDAAARLEAEARARGPDKATFNYKGYKNTERPRAARSGRPEPFLPHQPSIVVVEASGTVPQSGAGAEVILLFIRTLFGFRPADSCFPCPHVLCRRPYATLVPCVPGGGALRRRV